MKHRDAGKSQNVRNWLLQYSELKYEIDREIEQARYWKDKAVTLSSPNLDNLGIRSTGKNDISDYVVKFIELAQNCEKLAEEANLKRDEIKRAIGFVKRPDARQVLKLRYIDEMDFSDIARTMHYSVDWVYRLHRKGLKEIEESQSVPQVLY